MSQSTSDPVSGRVLTIRGQRVILDADPARLYGVPTFRLNEAVKRNADKFPDDFRFQLTREEHANLISQIAISSADVAHNKEPRPDSSQTAMRSRHDGIRKTPWAFTEHGALMAATVLNSPRAVHGVRQHGDGIAKRSVAARRFCLRASLSGCPAGR